MLLKPYLYLIDGSVNIYRAYHALRNLASSKGFPTNAIYGFTAMLVKLFQDHSPQYLGIVFDSKGPTFRHKIYDEYKATRPNMPDDLVIQIPYIKMIVKGFNIKSLELEGFEADDLIGTIAKKARAQGVHTFIVSGDKDFYQLIDENITIIDPQNDKVFGIKEVQERYGVNPDKIIEVLGLSGDSTDNIPGVVGVGEKTAIKLIQKYKSIKNLYGHLEEITQKNLKNKLIQGYENALLSRELVTINTQSPIPFDLELFRVTKPDPDSLRPIFKELEFTRFLKEFIPRKTPHPKKYSLVQTEKEFHALLHRLKESNSFALDLETTSKAPLQAKIVGFSFSFQPHQAFYIPVGHIVSEAGVQLSRDLVLTGLKPLLEDVGIKKFGQNIKYDYMVLYQNGVHLRGIEGDTMIASYLLNPSKRNHNLKEIAFEYLDYQMITYKDVTTQGKKSISFEEVSLKRACEYSGGDADVTFLLSELLFPKLKEKNLNELFYQIEMPLIEVLARMELAGVKVNSDILSEMSQELEEGLKDLEVKIYAISEKNFNINSPKQLSEILFKKLKLPAVSRTKTGYSTSIDVLNRLAQIHEMPALVLEYRRLSKLKSTYIDVLPKLINPETGRIHTTFNQTATATGRLSSSDPNLQNIPIRGEKGEKIRRAFVAEKGSLLLSADYSQIELRIMAHLSGDNNLKEAFSHDEDIHTRTAAEIFRVPPDKVTPSMRREAKVINFGVIYGMSHFGLSQELGIPWEEAKKYIENYFQKYRGVKRYIDETLEKARERGYVATLSGRIRHLPEINSSNKAAREFAERVAINTPIQGTAADFIKIAMIHIDRRIQKETLNAHMILQIHDELLFEVAKEEVKTLLTLVKEEMEGAMQLDVPVKATINYGKNWDEAH